jgi:hypothetical protein
MAATPQISVPLVGTLEATWAAIVKRHPDVPAAVVIVASGTEGRKSSEARWGHFAALRWVRGAAQLPEVLVAGEGLTRGAESVLATLLHEAAHGLAHVRKLKETSRQGRYHNRRYQVLAEELGLDVAEAGVFGWSSTTLRDATIKQYRRELRELQGALTLYRRGELTAEGGGKAKSTNLLPCSCACPRRIRVARVTFEAGPIVCGICDEEFTVVQEK